VPGVSGGTIALLLGFYATLLQAISVVLKSPLHARSAEGRRRVVEALSFLVPLGVGVVAAYWLATRLLVGKSESPGMLRTSETAPYFYGFFLGLVLASAVKVWRGVPSPGRRHVLLAAGGFVGAFLFAGLPHLSGEPPLWALVPGGAGAISVMLLPGVSGSLLLVILGQYTTVAGAVHDRNAVVLALFACGLLIGVFTTVPLLRALLARLPGPTLAALTGLMAGSSRALWPWKDQYDPKAGPLSNHLEVLAGGWGPLLGVVAAGLLGVVVVILLDLVERRLGSGEGAGTG